MNPSLHQLQQRLFYTLQDITTSDIADASVLIAITDERKPKIMLTRRASHLKSHAGEVSFAGGKYELADKDNMTTALREAHEETNLNPDNVQVIGQLKSQTSKSGLSVRPIIGVIPAEQALKSPLIAEKGEIARIFWVDLEWLIATPTTDYLKEIEDQGVNTQFMTPCWQVDGETVWGLTGMILMNLLSVGFDRNIHWYYKAITR